MKMLIIGHDTGEETVIDYCAGEDTTAICNEWKRVRGDSFLMVATWDVDELQDTLNTIRRYTEERLIEDFKQISLFQGETTHLHEKAAEAAAYERFVEATNRFKETHETANPDLTEHSLAEWKEIDRQKELLVTKHTNPASGDQLGAVDRTVLAEDKDPRAPYGAAQSKLAEELFKKSGEE